MSRLTLRAARPDDLALLLRWDDAPHLQDAGGDPEANAWDWELELGRDVPWRTLLIAEHGVRPIGFLQIIDPASEETHYWGECGPGLRAIDIWIGEADALGQGHGSEMMRLAIDLCFADASVEAILIDPLASNTDAHRFYVRLGFRFEERRTFLGVDECCVFRLTRTDWQGI